MEPIPFLGLLLLVGSLAFWGGWYIGQQDQHHAFECEHEWKATSARYNTFNNVKIHWASPERIDQLMLGVTTITEQCQGKCKVIRTRHVTGKVEVPGFVWKD